MITNNIARITFDIPEDYRGTIEAAATLLHLDPSELMRQAIAHVLLATEEAMLAGITRIKDDDKNLERLRAEIKQRLFNRSKKGTR
jgi:hypothetical protein